MCPPWQRHGPLLGTRTSSGNSGTGPPAIRPRRCPSPESAALSASLPGGFTTAARSLAMARCGAGATTTPGPVRERHHGSSSTPVPMTGPGVTWASSNTSVATIDATGRATGVNPGSTTITATDGGGANASTTLTVSGPTGQFTLSVVRAGSGASSVSSNPPGINCGSDCSEPYNSGTNVTLTATATGGSTFASWSGCNTVSGPTCSVTMNAAKTVTATFNPPRFLLTVSRTGAGSSNGSVSSSPPGISCGADCSSSMTAAPA